MQNGTGPITAAEIRAELARRNWPKYVFAAKVQIHPATLGRILAGRSPLTPALAERVKRVFESA
jgi:plasmid maintenance system antidote protein VapI